MPAVTPESIVLPVHETFQRTLQGEGYWAGYPCDFIRLAGCPVGCHFCDTGYAADHPSLPAPARRTCQELIDELQLPRVVITGGEPFIHSNLPDLLAGLIRANKKVAIETSGVRYQPVPHQCWLTVSPKAHLNERYPVMPQVADRANEIKIVIDDGSEIDFYQQLIEDSKAKGCPVYLQPNWFNDDSKQIAVDLAIVHGLRVSLQTHKYLGIQ